MLKLLRFKLMNRFPFVPAQLHSAALQPLSQTGSKRYSDKTKPSFPLALTSRLLHNNIYKIVIKMGGDSKTTCVKVRHSGYKIPGIKSALQHKFPSHPRVCLFQSIFNGRATSCLLLRTSDSSRLGTEQKGTQGSAAASPDTSYCIGPQPLLRPVWH